MYLFGSDEVKFLYENCNAIESNELSCEDPSSSRRSTMFGKQMARKIKKEDISILETINYRDFYSADDERKNNPGINPSSGMSKKRDFLFTEGCMVDEDQDSCWQILKKRRYDECSSSKQEMEYDVIVPLLNWYLFNEGGAEEDKGIPLVNKRTERRRKHSSLLNKQKEIISIPEGGNVVGSSFINCIEIKSASSEEEKNNEDGNKSPPTSLDTVEISD